MFVLAATAATALGSALGVNANLIMLGIIPWALCIAMAFSAAVHWMVRLYCELGSSNYTKIHCCELGVKKVLIRGH